MDCYGGLQSLIVSFCRNEVLDRTSVFGPPVGKSPLQGFSKETFKQRATFAATIFLVQLFEVNERETQNNA